MSPVSRGFRHPRRAAEQDAGRVPPGQHVTEGFPAEAITADIHCVTRWSKLGTEWRGVPVDTLLDQAGYDAPYVMAFCDGGYTANLPVADVTGGRAWVASSAPGEPAAVTVERLDDGEVSPYLTQELRAGDELELRGPVGGYFVWEPGDGGPLMLLAGGSGVVPLRSILRHRLRTGSDVPARLLYSARGWEDVIYRDELGQHHDGVQVSYTLTRGQQTALVGEIRDQSHLCGVLDLVRALGLQLVSAELD